MYILVAFLLTFAQASRTKIIFISFSTVKKPSHADVFIKARGKSLQKLRSEIVSHYPAPAAQTAKTAAASSSMSLCRASCVAVKGTVKLTAPRNPPGY